MQGSAETEAEQEKLLPEKLNELSNITYSDIAAKLLADKLLLTALELHCELTEVGKEIPKLKGFFSNPGNFEQNYLKTELPSAALTRWSSQATLDSLDMTRYSEDGEKVVDDRVAVLEFELRKARETINALRTNLTVAVESETSSQNDNKSARSSVCEPIKPHEQRALNFLINEYLLLHGYKLTSITFSDENGNQDFEVWDDVGLNIPKPPELLNLYREIMKYGYLNAASQSISTQTDGDIEEVELLISQLEKLKERISELEKENEELSANNDTISRSKADMLETVSTHFAAPTPDSGSLPDHFIMIDSSQVSNHDTRKVDTIETDSTLKDDGRLSREKSKSIEVIEDVESDESTSMSDDWLKLSECCSQSKSDDKQDIFDILTKKCDRHIPAAFQKEIVSKCYIDPGQMPGYILVDNLDTENDFDRFVHIIAGSVHLITPKIPAAFREDLILPTTFAIHYHSVRNFREKLMHLLFNLKKKPKDDERKAVLSGMVWLACYSDPRIVEDELLPLCWEELSHKYVERRLLVTELCCALCPYLSETSRNSTLLSILQQILLEDKDDRVKMSAINSIAFLVIFIADDDKYTQCEELLFTGLQDTSASVTEFTTHTLLPVLAKWALDIDKLESHLISRLLSTLEMQIKSATVQHKSESGSPFRPTLQWETKCSWSINAIRNILPYIVMYVANTPIVLQCIDSDLPAVSPRSGFSDVCRGLCNPSTFYDGKYSLGEIIRAFDASVTQHSWSQLDWLLTILIPKLINGLNQIDASQETLIGHFTTLFHSICSGFGRTAVMAKIQPIFVEKLKAIENKLANISEDWPNLAVLPVYMIAILVQFKELQDIQTVLRKFLFMLPICGYPVAILEYSIKELSNFEFVHEVLLSTLWEGVVHARDAVRLITVKLFAIVAANSSDFIIVNRIIPAIVTLSNDTDFNIKAATAQVLGNLITGSSLREVTDKCCFQLQTFLYEPNVFENHVHVVQLISTLGQIASHVDSNFREEIIIPQLATFTTHTLQLTNQIRKQELSRVLLDAYNLVIYCPFSRNVMTSSLLPGLRCLEAVCSESIVHRETISAMIREIESRLSTSDGSNVASTSISTVTANVGQEMKQRMSKILNKQGKFWKK